MGPKTMQLLKAMRGQLGDISASRSVDAVAAAEGLGMGWYTFRSFFLPLCNQVRGIGILRTSPLENSRKLRSRRFFATQHIRTDEWHEEGENH